MTEIGASRSVTLPVVPATAAVCPYLLAADGGWRASTALREHRCTAVSPGAALTPEKQRRLCLVAEHRGCSTYAAASGVGGIDDEPIAHDRRRAGRPVARTAPLLLDRGRIGVSMAALRPDLGFGQGGLVALMAVAFVAIVIARLSTGGAGLPTGQIAGGAFATPSAEATDRASADPAATPDDAPVRTLVPTAVEPTPTPDATEATEPTPTPAATQGTEATPTTAATPDAPANPATYTVRSGDSLAGIAGEFGTTWQVLAELNAIENPRALHVGQVIKLP